jgi:fatty acid desaturase
MDAEPTHREAIAALNGLELSALKETANGPALARLTGHAGILAISGAVILVTHSWLLWCLAILVYGIALVFLFSLEHEAIHGTAFRSQWLNTTVAEIAGLPLLLPPRYFRYFHFAHHRHTQNPENDPELATPKPRTWLGYLTFLSGLPYWRDAIAGIVRHALGRADEIFIPAGGKVKVIQEARAYVAIVVGLTAASLWLGSTWLLELWVIPALIGQPFLRAYLLAEHAACPLVADMLANSRTTYTTAIVRFLAWNMPYHAAHHAMPTVPFHRLPELNERLRDRLKSTADGYLAAHRQIRNGFAGARRNGPGRGATIRQPD